MDSANAGELRGNGFVLRPMRAGDAGLLVEASQTGIPDWTYLGRDIDTARAGSIIERGESMRSAGEAIRFVIDVDGDSAGTVGAAHPVERDRGLVDTSYFVLPDFRRRGLASKGLEIVDACSTAQTSADCSSSSWRATRGRQQWLRRLATSARVSPSIRFRQ